MTYLIQIIQKIIQKILQFLNQQATANRNAWNVGLAVYLLGSVWSD